MTMAAPEPLKVYCRGCHAKLDVSELEPFSYFPCPECGTRLRVPKRFDRYLLEKICGYGGMSTVYRAIEPELARRVGCPKGSRAVGQANHRNPLPIFLPCHRVVGAKGALTGYAGGLELKAWLLRLEGIV